MFSATWHLATTLPCKGGTHEAPIRRRNATRSGKEKIMKKAVLCALLLAAVAMSASAEVYVGNNGVSYYGPNRGALYSCDYATTAGRRMTRGTSYWTLTVFQDASGKPMPRGTEHFLATQPVRPDFWDGLQGDLGQAGQQDRPAHLHDLHASGSTPSTPPGRSARRPTSSSAGSSSRSALAATATRGRAGWSQ